MYVHRMMIHTSICFIVKKMVGEHIPGLTTLSLQCSAHELLYDFYLLTAFPYDITRMQLHSHTVHNYHCRPSSTPSQEWSLAESFGSEYEPLPDVPDAATLNANTGTSSSAKT